VIPGVRAAPQVLHDQIELVLIVLVRLDIRRRDPLGQLGPGVELGEIVLRVGAHELRQLLGAAEEIHLAAPAQEDRHVLLNDLVGVGDLLVLVLVVGRLEALGGEGGVTEVDRDRLAAVVLRLLVLKLLVVDRALAASTLRQHGRGGRVVGVVTGRLGVDLRWLQRGGEPVRPKGVSDAVR
jgi:hypothetical protein